MPPFTRSAVAFALVTVAAGWACSSSTSPTTGFASLSILGPSALRTEESAQFRTVGVRKDGSEEEVTAQWSVTGTSLTVEVASGSALGGQPGTVELRASAGSLSAARSIKVVPDIRGTWSGTTHFSCLKDNVAGEIVGPSICGKTLGWDYETVLNINAQHGESVVGTLTLHGDNGIRGLVSGSVLVDGTLGLGAKFTMSTITETGPYEYVFNDWRLLAQSSGISGSGGLEKKFTNDWGYQHYIFKAATITLQR